MSEAQASGEGPPAAHVVWTRGGEARIVAMEAQRIVLRSTVPWPPGSRVEGTVATAPPATLRVKVHASRRQTEGDFVVEGRPLDLARETRERIECALRGPG
jgi:hypothetical protein